MGLRKALEKTLEWEGFYSQDPNDPGGETIFGISRHNWPSWSGWMIVDDAKTDGDFPNVLKSEPRLRHLVEAFYYQHFWEPSRADILPEEIAEKVFDTSVNLGVRTACRMLQHTLNLLNRSGRSWEDIAEDGIIGPKTLRALSQALSEAPRTGTEEILNIYRALHARHYIELAERNPAMERYLRGWIRRALA